MKLQPGHRTTVEWLTQPFPCSFGSWWGRVGVSARSLSWWNPPAVSCTVDTKLWFQDSFLWEAGTVWKCPSSCFCFYFAAFLFISLPGLVGFAPVKEHIKERNVTNSKNHWVCWHMSLNLALGRWRQWGIQVPDQPGLAKQNKSQGCYTEKPGSWTKTKQTKQFRITIGRLSLQIQSFSLT